MNSIFAVGRSVSKILLVMLMIEANTALQQKI